MDAGATAECDEGRERQRTREFGCGLAARVLIGEEEKKFFSDFRV